MTFAGVVALITAFFQFFPTILKFVKLLQNSPAEEHAKILARMEAERTDAEAGGRPKW